MRVFSPQLGLNPDSSSGGEVYDVELLTGLAERGHHIDVLLRRGQKALKVDNIKIHYLPFFERNTKIYTICTIPKLFHFNSRIKELIRKSDIFRIHQPYFLALHGIIFKKIRKCPPLWLHYHHIESELQMKVFARILPKYADGITTVSTDTLTDLERVCPEVRNKLSEIITNGIDIETFKPGHDYENIRNELGIGKNERVILFVGHLVYRKGIDILMRAWKNLRKEYRNIHLVIIGGVPFGSYGESLEYLVKQYQKIDKNVHHISYIEKKDDLAKYYRMADIFAFPTRLEGFGRTVAEAMACETLVVTTNARGVRDIIEDGKTGYVVDVNDVEQFSEKLKIMLDDECLRIKIGKAARKMVEENFTWKSSIQKAEKFMNKLVS